MLTDGQKRTRIKKTNIAGKEWIQKLGTLVTDVFFPRRCPVCDEILEPENAKARIHPECQTKLYPVMGAVCMQCGRPLESQTGEYCYDCSRRPHKAICQGKSIFLYQGAVKKTMYRFKYSNKREYAEFFAEQAVAKYGPWMKEKQIEVIVPVPMYEKKRRVRGYNQAETFARALSKRTGIPVDTGLVLRVKNTKPQKELNDVERKNNLKNAFQIKENIVQYSHILVVDDIYTTGSTAEAVAEKLRKAQADHIYFMSICIGKGM